ncbi:hypothetical protein SRABI128_02795 [Microbacterium sp. Bi128]|nr:hypothetical protein SRABI128_02795 [Microbacterium sp. Bi128]
MVVHPEAVTVVFPTHVYAGFMTRRAVVSGVPGANCTLSEKSYVVPAS